MTRSKRAKELQIRPLDSTSPPSDNDTDKTPDPRVEAFLERLHKKAEALDAAQRKNHVTAKQPRRSPKVERAATPDWYQSVPVNKSAPPVSVGKRFVGKSGRKAKTS
ncbi:MAG: hypothetical protein GC179_15790 [Anaerolineaceae bacterium]|nr:hypothetical protein [Anaerolineaceae bacterium]